MWQSTIVGVLLEQSLHLVAWYEKEKRTGVYSPPQGRHPIIITWHERQEKRVGSVDSFREGHTSSYKKTSH